MRTIKLFGGPAHLDEAVIRDDDSRLMVTVRNHIPPFVHAPLLDVVNFNPTQNLHLLCAKVQ